MTARTVVVGVGNPYRRDDGVGPAVVDRLRERRDRRPDGPDGGLGEVRLAVTDGEPSRLIDLWDGAALAVVVDAVLTEPPRPGRVLELGWPAGQDEVPPDLPPASSHGLGFGSAVELATVLGRMPGRLVVYAVAGAEFGMGVGLSPAVADAVDDVAARVLATVGAATGRQPGLPVPPR